MVRNLFARVRALFGADGPADRVASLGADGALLAAMLAERFTCAAMRDPSPILPPAATLLAAAAFRRSEDWPRLLYRSGLFLFGFCVL